MSYSFAAASPDRISCGDPGRNTSAYSLALRFTCTAAAAKRVYWAYALSSGNYDTLCYFQITGTTNVIEVGFTTGGGASWANLIQWTSNWATDTEHGVVIVYTGTQLLIYADGDPTPKGSYTTSGTPDGTAGQAFNIGNGWTTDSFGNGGRICDVAWWPGTALSAALAGMLSGGFSPLFAPVKPSSYWPLIGDALDRLGGYNGTVTGATVAAHLRTLYPTRPLSVAVVVAAQAPGVPSSRYTLAAQQRMG